MTEIRICKTGWELYDAWTAALQARPVDTKSAAKAKRDYTKHRETCENCTPIKVTIDNDYQ